MLQAYFSYESAVSTTMHLKGPYWSHNHSFAAFDLQLIQCVTLLRNALAGFVVQSDVYLLANHCDTGNYRIIHIDRYAKCWRF